MEKLRSLSDFERKIDDACKHKEVFLYFNCCAGDNEKRKLNEGAFERYHIQPQILRNVTSANFSTHLLGHPVSFPVGIAPTAYHNLVHTDAEIATIKAAVSEGVITIVSCASSKTIAEIAFNAASSIKWLQIYIFKEKAVTLDLIRKAEDLGFSALVVTVDSPVGGLWKMQLQPEFFSEHLKCLPNIPQKVSQLLDSSLDFDSLLWLKSQTKLPIVVKGVLSAEDAAKAIKCGASAIYVSNHGGRQIDSVVPTMDVLREIVTAVQAEDSAVDVYLDGGIRKGSDVFKALALGAKAVFIGKPVIWGLTVGGEDGVRRVLEILKKEFALTMALAGVSSLKEISPKFLRKSCCDSQI